MPAGAIEHDHGEFVFAKRGGETIEENLHRLGVGIWQHERKTGVGAGLHARENISEREAPIAQAWRPFAALPPDMAGPAFLADARLILKERPDALILICTLNTSQQSRAFF